MNKAQFVFEKGTAQLGKYHVGSLQQHHCQAFGEWYSFFDILLSCMAIESEDR